METKLKKKNYQKLGFNAYFKDFWYKNTDVI